MENAPRSIERRQSAHLCHGKLRRAFLHAGHASRRCRRRAEHDHSRGSCGVSKVGPTASRRPTSPMCWFRLTSSTASRATTFASRLIHRGVRKVPRVALNSKAVGAGSTSSLRSHRPAEKNPAQNNGKKIPDECPVHAEMLMARRRRLAGALAGATPSSSAVCLSAASLARRRLQPRDLCGVGGIGLGALLAERVFPARRAGELILGLAVGVLLSAFDRDRHS